MTLAPEDAGVLDTTPGAEFARACARTGTDTSIELRTSITTTFLPTQQRRPRFTVRDLLRVVPVDADETVYAREAPVTPDPDEIRSASDAPEARFRYTTERARVGTIRASVEVPPGLMDDEASFGRFVDYRLVVRLCTAENDALLNGAGPDEIEGLLATPGLRRQGPRATVGETLLAAGATCELMGGSADGIVMHPSDWWPLNAEGRLLRNLADLGMRINRTRMVPPGFALVGDFHAGGAVLDRRTSTIRFAREGDDGFDSATPRLVAEIREGLAVHLPGHFVTVELPR